MNKIKLLQLLLLIFSLFTADVHARTSAPSDWRWRNDDGDLESATWAADKNSEATLVGHRDLIRLRTHMTGTFDPDGLKIKSEDSDTAGKYTAYFDYADSVHLTGEEPTGKLLGNFDAMANNENNPTFNDGGDCVVMKNFAGAITVPAGKFQELEICLRAMESTPEGTYTFLLPNADNLSLKPHPTLNYLHAKYADVTTLQVTNIEHTGATGNGDIIDLGLRSPVQHGVCWSVAENPTTADSKTEEGAVSKTGAFSTRITGLEKNTTYYLRAYATNSAGTVYGEQVAFTTGDSKESYGPGGCFIKALLP